MKRSILFSLAGASLLIACTPDLNERGYLADPQIEAGIQAGSDSKTSIQKRLGYPSTTATFGSDTWYYISTVEKQIAFFKPRIESRTILAVYFDKDGKVASLRHYSLKDGHVVAFEPRVTPTPGRELTFLQQLLNATPNPGSAGPQENQPTPGGGGLP